MVFGCVLLVPLLVGEREARPCGVKLKLKTPGVPKKVQRSENPSRVLMVGVRSRSLKRSLKAAGHRVDQRSKLAASPKRRYGAVITDRTNADKARERYPKAQIVIATKSNRRNLAEVERGLARGSSTTLSRRKRAVYARRRRVQGLDPDSGAAKPDEQNTPAAEARRKRRRRAARATKAPPRAKTNQPKRAPKKDAAPPKAVVEAPPAEAPAEAPVAEAVVEAPPVEAPTAEKPAVLSTVVVQFATKSWTLRSSHKRRLDRVVAWLEANASARVEVHGHTDSRGDEDANQALGLQRAESVKELLVDRGIDADRIETISHGESEPISDSNSKNRRVEIRPAD